MITPAFIKAKSSGLRAAFFAAAVLSVGTVGAASPVLVEQNGVKITVEDLKATFPPGSIGAKEARSFSNRSQADRVLDTLLAIKLAARDNGQSVKLTDEEQRHLAHQREKFLLDFSLELIELRVRERLAKPSDTIEKRSREIYDTVVDGFKVPETAEVAHILLRPGKGTLAERAALAEEIVKQARAGGDWNALVRKHSDDLNSLDKGGLVGKFMFAPGTDHPMVQAAFRSTVEKDISEPVISRSGIHVVKILKREPARRATYDEAKAQILDQIVRETVVLEQTKFMNAVRGPTPPKINEAELDKLIVKDDPELKKKLDAYYEALRTKAMDDKPQTK